MKAFLVRFLPAVGVAAIVSIASNSSPQDAPVNDKDIHYLSGLRFERAEQALR